jgi:ribosome-associated protein
LTGFNVTQPIDFDLKGEFIPLDALLKTTGFASSGGTAKAMVAAGQVQVDGQLELRKRCKIRAGQVVSAGGVSIRVIAADGGESRPR